MAVTGVDLNATRIRAVNGPSGAFPLGVRLEEQSRDLFLALNLAEKKIRVGRIGLSQCRQQPQFAVVDFLPSLGSTRKWTGGRHNLDAAGALAICLDRLQLAIGKSDGVVITVPTSVGDRAFAQIEMIGRKARLPVLGTLPTPLAAVHWAYQRHPWEGVALVGDVDGGCFSWSAVSTDGGQARLLEKQVFPRLGRNAWLMRLLDGVANRCIRLSRRDPRQIPLAEQALFDQLLAVIDNPPGDRLVEFNLRSAQWAQHLVYQMAELEVLCTPLVEEIILRMKQCLAQLPPQAPGQIVLLTASARALPGLQGAVEQAFRNDPLVIQRVENQDFGESLLQDGWLQPGDLAVLDPDAVAIAAHEIACAIERKELAGGHQEVVRLIGPVQTGSEARSQDTGPARIQFGGRDLLLGVDLFTLGWDSNCSLVLDAELFPQVGRHHCDIVLDQRHYLLRDHSRQGTLVNDRPVQQTMPLNSGDWIRLGPGGPVVRFVGQTVTLRPYRETE